MLGVIACHFNPAGFRAPVRNWQLWRRQFPADLPLVTVELAFRENSETDAGIVRRGTTRQVLWQKEALLNLALQQLPPEVDRVAWIDADVVCPDAQWLQKTAAALDLAPLVQMFRTVTVTDQNLQPEHTWPGAVAAQSCEYHLCKPGFAWACRREILDRYGLYPYFVVGAGDIAFLNAARGEWLTAWLMRYHDSVRQPWLQWGRQLYREIQGQVGFVDVPLIHLHHGSRANRQYATREQLLVDHQFDPARHVALSEGVLEWTSLAPEPLIAGVTQFFLDRKEDQ